MQTCTICNCRSNVLPLNLGLLPRERRLPLVQRILGLLIESRFENGSASQLNAFGEARDVVPAVCLDLHPMRFPVPAGRKRLSEAPKEVILGALRNLRDQLIAVPNTALRKPLFDSPSTMGRGSPHC